MAKTYTWTAPPAAPGSVAAALQADGSLAIGTTYYYTVLAVTKVCIIINDPANAFSPLSAEVSATPTSGNQKIKITWATVTGAAGYCVFRSTTSGSYCGTNRFRRESDNSKYVCTVTGLEFTDEGDDDPALAIAVASQTLPATVDFPCGFDPQTNGTGYLDISGGSSGGKMRSVFLGSKCKREMTRYLRCRRGSQPGDALWVTGEGKRLTYSGLREIVRRLSGRAGVDCPSLHSFRRAFALACLRGGMDLISLQRLMGHADLTVLRRYLNQTVDDLALAHQRCGPVDTLL